MSAGAIEIALTATGWESCGGTSARGYAHIDGRFRAAQDIARAFDACMSDEQWQTLLKRCNGCFAIVSRRGSAVFAAVDRLRSIPLFFDAGAGPLRLSDSAERVLADASECRSNPLADVEFQLTGYVTGGQTLVDDVRQIRAGEFLRWDADARTPPLRSRYYAFEHGDYFTTGSADLVDRLEMLHECVFRRLLEGVGDRQIAVPLSGGYDSRLIGVSLRDLGARDVVCYSYGLPGNWEAGISQELARYLGFRWEFVPYSPDRWRAWAATEPFAQYFRAAGNLTSVPHVQDWPAVLELKREGKVAPDAVFVPGHSGDFLAGSHIPPSFVVNPMVRRRDFLETLLRSHYSLWDWPAGAQARLQALFTERIEAVIGRVSDVSAARAADLFEQWDLEERQAKFICNSVRVYEFFGHEWRLPLFDHELMDFWARVPVNLRVGRKLYFEYARERQDLPVTSANTDRNAVMRSMVHGVTAVGLKPLAKRLRQAYRTWRWRDEYESAGLGWFALVDEDAFRRTYTGKELLHSYLAVEYRDFVFAGDSAGAKRSVVPALANAVTRAGNGR